MKIIEQWRERLELKYKLIVNGHEDEEAHGGEEDSKGNMRDFSIVLVGYGKNRAVQYSSGKFLCFQDAV